MVKDNKDEQQGASHQDLDFNVQIQAADSNLKNQKPPKSDIEQFRQQNFQEVKIHEDAPQQETLQIQQGKSEFVIQIFQMIFKILALLLQFMFIHLYTSFFLLNLVISEVGTFILVVILNAFDFWCVKNVSGRKLLGLRWWSEIREDGEEVWLYESMDANFKPNSCNTNVFWSTQVIDTFIWAVLVVVDLISLNLFWCLLAWIGMLLSGLNLVGYYRCRGEHQKKAKDFVARLGIKAIQGRL